MAVEVVQPITTTGRRKRQGATGKWEVWCQSRRCSPTHAPRPSTKFLCTKCTDPWTSSVRDRGTSSGWSVEIFLTPRVRYLVFATLLSLLARFRETTRTRFHAALPFSPAWLWTMRVLCEIVSEDDASSSSCAGCIFCLDNEIGRPQREA